MQDVKKVVIIGPESTGKSTLSKALASHFNTLWCPEYAREYLLTYGTSYGYDDLLRIAEGQIALEAEHRRMVSARFQRKENGKLVSGNEGCNSEAVANNTTFSKTSPLLFVDTDMYVMKVWCEFVFSNCHYFILDSIVENKADLYLLCNVDLPWVKDELREYPDVQTREELYHYYKDIMVNQTVPWIDIRGNYDERLRIAIDAVMRYFFTAGV